LAGTSNHVPFTRQHTATHCNTLQHTATHYNTLQHTATTHTCINTLAEVPATMFSVTTAMCECIVLKSPPKNISPGMCVYVWICVYVYMCTCVYVYVCMCVWVYVCMCVCVYVQVHRPEVRPRTSHLQWHTTQDDASHVWGQCTPFKTLYAVAGISRPLKIIRLFCKRAL